MTNPALSIACSNTENPIPMPEILVCTDGSRYAPSIYKHAAWAAGRMEASIHLVHVIEREETPPTHDLSGSLGFRASDELMEELTRLDESHARLAKLRGRALLDDAEGHFPGMRVTSTQRHGALVEAIGEYEKESDLIVLGKRGGHADFAEGHLGSNLERVVRAARVPVLVAARAFRPIVRFTMAFDGGPSAWKAVRHLAGSPLLKGAVCDVLFVGKDPAGISDVLESAASELRNGGIDARPQILAGDPDEVIADRVAKAGSDLLVMGAYGHSRVRQFILGSTTTELIRTCHVPVMLFR